MNLEEMNLQEILDKKVIEILEMNLEILDKKVQEIAEMLVNLKNTPKKEAYDLCSFFLFMH